MSDSESKHPPRGKRTNSGAARPGWIRRVVVRGAAWGVVIIAIALLGVALILRSDWAREKARVGLEEQLGRYLDRVVGVESVSFTLLPLSVDASGLRISGPGTDGPVFFEVERVFVAAGLSLGRPPGLTLQEVLLERPRLFLEFYAGEGSNLPHLRGAKDKTKGESRVVVDIQSLTVSDGAVETRLREYPVDFVARGFSARSLGARGRFLRGEVRAREFELTLPQGRPYLGSVEARLRQVPDRLEFESITIDGPDLEAKMQGALVWRGERGLELEVSAQARSTLLEELGYSSAGVEGDFLTDGFFRWIPGDWSYRGDLRSKKVDLMSRMVTGVRGNLTADREQVLLDLQQGSYAQGSLTGTVAARLQEADRPVSIDLKFSDLDFDRLLADQGIPVNGLAGRAGGDLSYRFEPAAAAEGSGWANLRVSEAAGESGRIPVSGQLPAVIVDGRISGEAFRIVSESQDLGARGWYDLASATGEFDFELGTTELKELAGLLAIVAEEEPWPLWLPTAGFGSITGKLNLQAGRVLTETRIDLEQAVAPGLTADQILGAISVVPGGVDRMRLDLSRSGGGLIVAGSVPFGEGEADSEGTPPFDITVDVVGWPLAEFEPWLPFVLPIDGSASGRLSLSGDVLEPSGSMSAEILGARTDDMRLGDIELDIGFSPAEVVIGGAAVNLDAGRVTLDGRIDNETGALNLDACGPDLDLARSPFSDLLPGEIAGSAELNLELAGTLSKPQAELTVLSGDLSLGGKVVEGADGSRADLRWNGERVDVSVSVADLLSAEGEGDLTTDAIDIGLSIRTGELRDLLQLASVQDLPEFSGSADGSIRISSYADSPGGVEIGVNIGSLAADYQGLQLENLEPIEMNLGPDGLQIASIYLGTPGEESEFFLSGRIGEEGPDQLSLNVQSTLATGWLEILIPQLTFATGSFDLLANVRGSLAEPHVNGQGEIRGGQVLLPEVPSSFDQVDGTILFYPKLVVIDRLAGRAFNGRLLAGGELRLYESRGVVEYQFQVSGEDLHLRYPEGWQLRGDAELQISSVPGGRRVTGALELGRAFYLQDVPIGFAQLLKALFEKGRLEVGETDELLATTEIDLHVDGESALRVRNNLANLSGDVDFVVRGNLARPVVFGRVELDSGGMLIYSGTEYQIDRGLLSFVNPYRIEPIVDLVATTKTREYELTLSLTGPPDHLNASFASDPPMADLAVLSLLTSGGGAAVAGGSASTSSESSAAESFLYSQAASMISQRAGNLFGLDTFRIDPLTEQGGSLSAARVTVGQQVSRDLYVTYSYDPSETDRQILQIEWQIDAGLVLVLTQESDGSYALDVEKQIRF